MINNHEKPMLLLKTRRNLMGFMYHPSSRRVHLFFFAIDNTDFAEDTVAGKSTTHGTITAVYQKASAPGEPVAHNLEICEADSLSVLPYHVPIKPCSKPKSQEGT